MGKSDKCDKCGKIPANIVYKDKNIALGIVRKRSKGDLWKV